MKRKRRTFTIGFKKQVVRETYFYGRDKVAERYDLCPYQVNRWQEAVLKFDSKGLFIRRQIRIW